MGILDDLISVKSTNKRDELLTIIDEVSIYQKLAVDDKLKDLTTCEVTRKKCPLLARYADGQAYESILAELAANVYLQIEGTIPDVLNHTVNRTEKQQKQFKILQSGIAQISYRDLLSYDHDTMKDHLAAVFIKKHAGGNTAVIVTRRNNGYTMYHGTYMKTNALDASSAEISPIVVSGQKGCFMLKTYSMLGNNGYPFAKYATQAVVYDVMLDPNEVLYLVAEKNTIAHQLSASDRNILNMSKNDPKKFADELTKIIEKVV